VAPLVFADPATHPTTQPAKQRFSLMHGAVRYMIPGGYKEAFRDEADRNAQYDSPDGKVKIIVGVTPQEHYFPKDNDAIVDQLKNAVINAIRKKYQERGDKFLYGPRNETDDRFVAHIHDRYVHDGQTYDELHVYRALGLDLLMVMTQVNTADPNEAKPLQEMGQDVSLSIILGPADKKKLGK
jgi:hypothetical protein